MAASAGGTTGIVATGANGLTFTGVVTAGSIDASALTGVLTVTAAPANAVTIRGGSAADVITGSASADLIVGGNGADSITGGAGNDSIDLTETTAAVDKFTFSGAAVAAGAAPTAMLTANGFDTIIGFGATDTINVNALGDNTTTTALTAITAAAAQGALTNDNAIVISATGAAASLTTAGTATITDFTNLTQVAAYLTERFTVTASANRDVIVFNNTSGNNDTTFVYSLSNSAADTTIDAADLVLVGQITHVAGTALTNSNVVFA
jgi:hypothetical protein